MSHLATVNRLGNALTVRAAVVGFGIVGACVSFELASAGADVTAFEQFEVDHDRGSSFGDSRIIRRFYDDQYYTQLMTAAYPLWRRLEAQAGARLIETMGGLYFGPRDHPRLASAIAGLRALGMTPTLLEAPQLRARFRAFVFSDGESGLIDDEAGSLRASRCVRAAASAAASAGANIQLKTKVERIDASRGAIDINLEDGSVERFDRVIVCAGSWTGKLLGTARFPVRSTRQQYVYFEPTRDRLLFAPGAMPIWIDAASNWYGFPEHGDVAGVKIASHDFGETIDPDDVNRDVDSSIVARTRDYARKRIPALADGAVTYSKVCLYTVTPDEDFIVDVVPGIPGCFVIGGCSGHAFKFAPLLGVIGAHLTFDREPPVDISRFRMARFDPSKNPQEGHESGRVKVSAPPAILKG